MVSSCVPCPEFRGPSLVVRYDAATVSDAAHHPAASIAGVAQPLEVVYLEELRTSRFGQHRIGQSVETAEGEANVKLLRANPAKDGDAELRGYSDEVAKLAGSPALLRDVFGEGWRFCFFHCFRANPSKDGDAELRG